MRVFILSVFTICITIVLSGCGSMKDMQGLFKKSQYEIMMERQRKIDSASDQNKITRKLPAIKAEEYERLGDNYVM